MPTLTPQDVVLFQGDSITDAGRDRDRQDTPNDPSALGGGYAKLAASALLEHLPGIQIYNRGISGNRAQDLKARWQADCLDLKPTLLSILIGVNDTWHGTASGNPDKVVPIPEYESDLTAIIKQYQSAVPEGRVMICEPFVLEAGAVLEKPFHPEIDERRKAAQRVAQATSCQHVPFQSMFDDAVTRAEPAYWAADGVHPSLAGHRLMADTWLGVALA